MGELPDEAIADLTGELRSRLAGREGPKVLLEEAFAAACEALRRAGGGSVDEESLFAASVLQRGAIAEVSPGADIDVPTMLAAYLRALSGGVHVVTPDDAAARRTAQRMAQAYQLLGLRVGLVVPGLPLPERRTMCQADVTFGSFTEFGYDYLRDNLAWKRSEVVQSDLGFAVVQQADRVLRDDGRVPFIISGPAPAERGGKRCRESPRG
jgi:preprotein translocase subunit SecA